MVGPCLLDDPPVAVARMTRAYFFSGPGSPKILIIGKREVGKSTLVRDLLFDYDSASPRDLVLTYPDGPGRNKGIVVTVESDFRENIYANYDVHADFSERSVRRTIDDPCRAPRAFVVLDDPIYDKTGIETLSFMLNTVRHDTLLIVALQYPFAMADRPIESLHFICLFRETIPSNRRRIYNLYADKVFPAFESFCGALDECTDAPHECLVLKVRGRTSSRLRDNVFRYRAELHATYDYAALRARMDVHREALAAAAFHPRRLARWLADDGEGEWMS